MVVSRAEPPAAAAMCEDDNAARPVRDAEQALKAVRLDPLGLDFRSYCRDRHGSAAPAFAL